MHYYVIIVPIQFDNFKLDIEEFNCWSSQMQKQVVRPQGCNRGSNTECGSLMQGSKAEDNHVLV